tara:strand:- start:80729 stop:81529 length:801 start_codon:yes stop_codon:yes gene_type:complete
MQRRIALLFIVLPVALLSSLPALAVNVEAIETARTGETKDVVCARAREEARTSAAKAVLEGLQKQPEYSEILDRAQWQGDSQRDLDVALSEALSSTVEMIDMGEVWSGRSCLYRGIADADTASVIDAFQMRYARKAPAASGTERADVGFGTGPETLGIDKLRNVSLLQSALAQLSVIKFAVTEYRMLEDKWPSSLAELGFQADDLIDTGNIHDVTLGRDGSINARFKGALSGHSARLIPQKASFRGISWRCETTVVMLRNSGCQGP